MIATKKSIMEAFVTPKILNMKKPFPLAIITANIKLKR